MATATTTAKAAAVVVAAMVASAMGTGQAVAASPDMPTVVLHVAALIEVPADQLADAQKTASQTYAHIGVRLVWTGGFARTAAADGALHLDVILIGAAAADRMNANRTAFGQAIRAAQRAYIYLGRIVDHARHTSVDPAWVLALVLAHEVGHMLLPEYSHAPSGLMRATWDGRIVDVPDFAADQAATIRTLLTTTTAAN
jgi:hypothetical protein